MQNDQSESQDISKPSDFPFPPPAQIIQDVQLQPPHVVSPTDSQTQQAQSQAYDKPSNPKKFNFSKIIKILIGIVVVILVIAAIFYFGKMFLSKNASTGGVSITYWGLWEDSKTMQSIISDFERKNPSIKVEYSKQDAKQYRERLLTRVDNGTGPDVFNFHNTWYPMVSSILLPLPSDLINKEKFNSLYYPVAQQDLEKNGAIYGIPQEVDTLVMYINNDIFNSVGADIPANWNDFIDVSRRLTVKDESGKIKTAGAALGTFDNITHAPDILSLLFLQNSVDFKNLDSTSDRAIGALSFYSAFATDQNNTWDSSLDPSLLAFAKGDLAIFFGYSWDYFTIKAFNPSINLQIVSVPQLSKNNVNLASYWANGVSLKSKHQKEATLFLKFLSEKDTVEKLYLEESKERAFGEPYARTDLAGGLRESIIYPVVTQAVSAKSSFFVDSTNDNGINQQLNTYLGNAVNSITSGTSVDTAFETFKQGVSQVLEKYGEQ